MASTMTASAPNVITTLTDEQIENAVDQLRDAMRMHRSEITTEAAQRVLGFNNLGMMLFDPFRKRGKAISNMIVRRVRPDRNRNPWEVLNALDCVQDFGNVVAEMPERKLIAENMPRGEGEEVDVCFFMPDQCDPFNAQSASDTLERDFELRGLKPADPYSLAAVKEADPTFADDRLLGTRWKDASGTWCAMVFIKAPAWEGGKRWVKFYRSCTDWSHGWLVAGIPK